MSYKIISLGGTIGCTTSASHSSDFPHILFLKKTSHSERRLKRGPPPATHSPTQHNSSVLPTKKDPQPERSGSCIAGD